MAHKCFTEKQNMKNSWILSLLAPAVICSAFAEERIIPKNREQTTKFKEIENGKELSWLNSNVKTEHAFQKKELKVLVWNVFKGVKKDIFKKFPGIAEKYDLALIQEAYTTPDMMTMFAKTPFRYTLAGSFIYRPENVTTGVATGSMIEAKTERPFRSKYKEPIVDAAQMCLASEFVISGITDKLMVVNVHAINFVPSEMLFHQLEQIKQQIEGHKGPVILAGDFNVWDEKKTKYLMRIAKMLSLSQVAFQEDHRKTFKGFPLDHIFYRGIKLKSATTYKMNDLSDHNPLEAVFELP